MKSSVIIFPGSNCDRDMDVALKKFGFKNQMIWHNDTDIPKSDLIVLPGGFSYGDYLRSGAIAGKSLIVSEIIKAANSGCLILGIRNGFQILTETGLPENDEFEADKDTVQTLHKIGYTNRGICDYLIRKKFKTFRTNSNYKPKLIYMTVKKYKNILCKNKTYLILRKDIKLRLYLILTII